MCVTLTPAAAKFMSRMIRFGNAGQPSNSGGFRLSVEPGGCSGFESRFSVEQAPRPGDMLVLQEGVTVFLPEDTYNLLAGYTIDFRESRLEGGFVFHNPDLSHGCGCSSVPAAAGTSAQRVRFRPGTWTKP